MLVDAARKKKHKSVFSSSFLLDLFPKIQNSTRKKSILFRFLSIESHFLRTFYRLQNFKRLISFLPLQT